jgi:hypothetical protein
VWEARWRCAESGERAVRGPHSTVGARWQLWGVACGCIAAARRRRRAPARGAGRRGARPPATGTAHRHALARTGTGDRGPAHRPTGTGRP